MIASGRFPRLHGQAVGPATSSQPRRPPGRWPARMFVSVDGQPAPKVALCPNQTDPRYSNKSPSLTGRRTTASLLACASTPSRPQLMRARDERRPSLAEGVPVTRREVQDETPTTAGWTMAPWMIRSTTTLPSWSAAHPPPGAAVPTVTDHDGTRSRGTDPDRTPACVRLFLRAQRAKQRLLTTAADRVHSYSRVTGVGAPGQGDFQWKAARWGHDGLIDSPRPRPSRCPEDRRTAPCCARNRVSFIRICASLSRLAVAPRRPRRRRQAPTGCDGHRPGTSCR